MVAICHDTGDKNDHEKKNDTKRKPNPSSQSIYKVLSKMLNFMSRTLVRVSKVDGRDTSGLVTN